MYLYVETFKNVFGCCLTLLNEITQLSIHKLHTNTYKITIMVNCDQTCFQEIIYLTFKIRFPQFLFFYKIGGKTFFQKVNKNYNNKKIKEYPFLIKLTHVSMC